MPGRGKTPVQQAWEYANDAPGAKWVLVSNCVEVRLYGYGRGREAYEVFDLSRLDELDELRRLWVVLAATNLLGDATERLLRDTDAAHADITDKLYQDYSGLRERLIAFLTDSADGPKLALGAAIEPAQKILDRILFIAFAQRRDLMRDGLLERALKAGNEFDPQPMWRNFSGFSARRQGRPRHGHTALQRRPVRPGRGRRFARSARSARQGHRRARQLGLSQRSAGDRARPHFRAIDHRHREKSAPRRAAKRRRRCRKRKRDGRRLHAGHGDAIPRRADALVARSMNGAPSCARGMA